MKHKIVIAIIDSNALARMGMQNMLEEIIPMVDIKAYQSFDEIRETDIDVFAHFFVASRIYFENATFFRQYPVRTIILVNGDMEVANMRTLNVCQDETHLVRDILALRALGHGRPGGSSAQGHPHGQQRGEDTSHDMTHSEVQPTLSPREMEVAILLCKGLINKEVADRLSISLTTAITHRKNIMAKLGARSLADITIYCVMNGIVDAEDL